MYLAREQRHLPPVTIAEVSTQFKVPRNHLVKVAGLLTKSGWIDATRGRSGGIRLAVEPSTLRLGKVIRVLEGRKEIIDCEQLECGLSNVCGLRSVLKSAYDAFYVALDAYTLADIIGGSGGQEISRMHKSFLEIYLANPSKNAPLAFKSKS